MAEKCNVVFASKFGIRSHFAADALQKALEKHGLAEKVKVKEMSGNELAKSRLSKLNHLIVFSEGMRKLAEQRLPENSAAQIHHWKNADFVGKSGFARVELFAKALKNKLAAK